MASHLGGSFRHFFGNQGKEKAHKIGLKSGAGLYRFQIASSKVTAPNFRHGAGLGGIALYITILLLVLCPTQVRRTSQSLVSRTLYYLPPKKSNILGCGRHGLVARRIAFSKQTPVSSRFMFAFKSSTVSSSILIPLLCHGLAIFTRSKAMRFKMKRILLQLRCLGKLLGIPRRTQRRSTAISLFFRFQRTGIKSMNCLQSFLSVTERMWNAYPFPCSM